MREHENLPGTAGNSGQLRKLRGIHKREYGHEQM